MFRAVKAWHLGCALIVAAIIALVLLGWSGLRSQRAVVWQEANDDCERLVAQMSPAMSFDTKLAETLTVYAYPPEPGDIQFSASADMATLQGWQLNGGTTTAGLPVRVMAGMALLHKKPTLPQAKTLAALCTVDEPSIITAQILTEIDLIAQQQSWQIDLTKLRAQWDSHEKIRSVFEHQPPSGWLNHQGQTWWISPASEGKVFYVTPEKLEQYLAERWQALRPPVWAAYSFRCGNSSIPKGGIGGRSLASRSHAGITLQVGVKHPDLLEKNWRLSRRWSILMMTLAILSLIGGLSVIAIGMRREQIRAHEQSNFVASVTHELRAPVGSMRLMAEALEAGKLTPDKAQEFHRLMAREGSRLSCLIENVLDISKLESGRAKIRRQHCNLATLVADAVQTLHMQAAEKNISIEQGQTPLTIHADPLAMQQILVNLIDNAIKFSPVNGRVHIDWSSNQTNWQLTVRDHGPGVPEGDEKRIFDRFYRAGDEIRRESQGAGIGLHLVNQITLAHGGKITVTNDGGAVFTLTFPHIGEPLQSDLTDKAKL